MKARIFSLRLLLPAFMVFMTDQLLKLFIRQAPLYAVLISIPGIADVTHCVNTGAAFSLLSGHTGLIMLLSSALLLLLLVRLLRDMRLTARAEYALSVLLGGGLGNLTDRMLFGGVTDYIRLSFIDFPVFNLADICITFSVCILAFDLLTGRMDKHPGE